jgi:tRNA(Ile2) C34 agmatinyltransferase TiaS
MDRAPAKNPLCPNCGKHMKLTRVIAGAAGLAPVNVFECAPCGIYYSEAHREPSPVKGSGKRGC